MNLEKWIKTLVITGLLTAGGCSSPSKKSIVPASEPEPEPAPPQQLTIRISGTPGMLFRGFYGTGSIPKSPPTEITGIVPAVFPVHSRSAYGIFYKEDELGRLTIELERDRDQLVTVSTTEPNVRLRIEFTDGQATGGAW